MRKQHVQLVSCSIFGFSLVLLLAYPISSVQAAAPITSSGLNTRSVNRSFFRPVNRNTTSPVARDPEVD